MEAITDGWTALEAGVRLLDVPAHKTGAPFTKPVDAALVGPGDRPWEAVRPAQPPLARAAYG